jgi:hypothetical protein
VIDSNQTRDAISAMVSRADPLDVLADLGAVHAIVLDMMAEHLGRMRAEGFSSDAVAAALGSAVAGARRQAARDTALA